MPKLSENQFSAVENFTKGIDARDIRTVRFRFQRLALADYDTTFGGWRLFPQLLSRFQGITPGGLGWLIDAHVVCFHDVQVSSANPIGFPAIIEGANIALDYLDVNGLAAWRPTNLFVGPYINGIYTYYTLSGETIVPLYSDAAASTLGWKTPTTNLYASYPIISYAIRYVPYSICRPRLNV